MQEKGNLYCNDSNRITIHICHHVNCPEENNKIAIKQQIKSNFVYYFQKVGLFSGS